MEIRQLKNFLVVAELENVNRASARLHIAQTALSRQIQKLEEELGVKLFQREGKRIRLSAEGAVYLEEARSILAHIDSAKNKVALAARGIVGHLRVGFHQVAGRHRCVADAVKLFRRENPSIAVELIPLPINSQVELIRTRGLDAGLLYLPFKIPDLVSRRVQTENWAIALPSRHPLARARNPAARDLQQENFIAIAHSRAPHQLDALQAACQIAGLTPRVIQEVHEEAMLLNLVAVGMGVGFVMDTGYRPEGVVIRKLADLQLPQHFCVAWRKDNLAPMLKRFVDCVVRTSPDA